MERRFTDKRVEAGPTARRRAAGESGLEIRLDSRDEIPLYVQLKNQLRYLVQTQQLPPGSQLPTMRQLALDLGIDANTVARVYRELELEGLIERQQGRGTFVSSQVPATAPDAARKTEAEGIVSSMVKLLQNLHLTRPEVAALLRSFADRLEKE